VAPPSGRLFRGFSLIRHPGLNRIPSRGRKLAASNSCPATCVESRPPFHPEPSCTCPAPRLGAEVRHRKIVGATSLTHSSCGPGHDHSASTGTSWSLKSPIRTSPPFFLPDQRIVEGDPASGVNAELRVRSVPCYVLDLALADSQGARGRLCIGSYNLRMPRLPRLLANLWLSSGRPRHGARPQERSNLPLCESPSRRVSTGLVVPPQRGVLQRPGPPS
jgi:hypothetical protein